MIIFRIFFTFLIYFSLFTQTNENILTNVFGSQGINLSEQSFLCMKELFHELSLTNEYQQMIACKKASNLLQLQIKAYERNSKTVSLFNLPLFTYQIMILTIQKEHFERVARIFNQNIKWYKKIYGWLAERIESFWCSITSFISPRTPIITNLAQNLFTYTEIERYEIFPHHESALTLLVCQNTQSIPLIIRFWDFTPHRHKLLNGIKEFYQGAVAQAEAFVDAGEDIAGQTGASIVTETTGESSEAIEQGLEATQDITTAEKGLSAILSNTPEDTNKLTPKEALTDEQNFETTTTELEKKVLQQWTKSAGIKTKTLEEIDTSISSIEISENIFTQNATALEKESDALAQSSNEALQKVDTVGKKAWGATKGFCRQIHKSSQWINSNVNPLAIAMKKAEALENVACNAGSKIADLYNKSFLKTGLDQFGSWLKDSSLGKAYEGSAAQKAIKVLSYAFKPAKIIFNYAKKLTLTNLYRAAMETTMGKMTITMIEQSEISMGAQEVAAWQSASDALTFAALAQQRTDLAQQLQKFFSQLSVKQSTALANINANFAAQSSQIATLYTFQPDSTGNITIAGALPSLLSLESNFLSNALINATVKQVFLNNPFYDDQQFYCSPMIIPGWYNPYRIGNWQFCSVNYATNTTEKITSFVQYNAQSCISSKYPKGDPTLALQNSIFTEYIPPKEVTQNDIESYQIIIDCTLLEQPAAPFIMGVIFNGARWVSGIMDFHQQHRLFCIYALPGQKKKTMNVGFAETFYKTPTDMEEDQLQSQITTNAVWPALQLLTTDQAGLVSAAEINNIALISNPLEQIPSLEIESTYRFIITNQADQVNLAITKQPDNTLIFPAKNSISTVASNTKPDTQGYPINLLNNLIFLYHNIGFIAAGCSAQFIIQKPIALLYNNKGKTLQKGEQP